MRLRCFSIYDRKTLAYHAPYYAVTDAAAVRTFSDVVADPNTIFGRHPDDHVLYCVGEFDDQSGMLLPNSPALHIVDANVLVRALQQEIPFPDQVTTTKPSAVENGHIRQEG